MRITASVPVAATGTVTFYEGVTILGTATISSGQAVLTTRLLNAGAPSLRAHYSGDRTYAPSDSAVTTQRIDRTPVSSIGMSMTESASTTPGAYLISTVAGAPYLSTAVPATTAMFLPGALAVDPADDVYVSGQASSMVFRIDRDGNLTRVAGNGTTRTSSDLPDGSAISVPLSVTGLATDRLGNLYIAEPTDVRLVSPSGHITTVASVGGTGLLVDGSGNLYFSDPSGNVVRKRDTNGAITTVAGTSNGGYSGDGGPATAAQLSSPVGLALDSSGALYIADSGNNVVRRVSADGTITTVAGNGSPGFSGDDGPATQAQLDYPAAVALDSLGNLYISDYYNARIREVSGTTIATLLASGFVHDGGSKPQTPFQPADLAIDSTGNLVVTDHNGYVWKISGNTITTVAGGGTGNNAVAALGMFSQPTAITKDQAGNLYVSDSQATRIRLISPTGALSTVAGNGTSGFYGDGGPATAAQLGCACSLAVDSTGALYIADTINNRVRRLYQGVITTIAGNGSEFYSGDGLPATSSGMSPFSIAFDRQDNLYIADPNSSRVLKVTRGGIVSSFAGSGIRGLSGDSGPATAAKLLSPLSVSVDAQGNVYISDSYQIRMVNTAGIITTIGGNGWCRSTGDGGTATLASVCPFTIDADSVGNLFIADEGDSSIRVINTSGIISTIAGGDSGQYTGPTTGPATNSPLAASSLYADASGIIYVADDISDAIRLLTLQGGPPVLTISSAHDGTFPIGSIGHYALTVSNLSLSGPTNGTTVTVTEIPPEGMSISSMSGTGWSCSGNSCTRADGLAAGDSYPILDVVAAIDNQAPMQLTNQATVGGGGAATTAAQDLTLLTAPPVTIQTSPTGLQFSTDNLPSEAAPQTLELDPGPHLVSAPSPQAGGTGFQFAFAGWSDSGAQTHSIDVTGASATTRRDS